MADPTLTIQYSDTVNDLVIHAADGSVVTVVKAVDADTPRQQALARPHLVSPDLIAAIRAGSVAFVAPSSPTADEQRLAVDVMRVFLGGLGLDLVTTSRRMLASEASLAAHRDTYNLSHAAAKAVIIDGHLLEAGATNLANAAAALLVPKVEQAAVTAATQAITDLDAAFLIEVNGQDPIDQQALNDYLAERHDLEAALATAQARLSAAQGALAGEFGAVTQELTEAAWVMENLDGADVANPLAWTWTLPPMP